MKEVFLERMRGLFPQGAHPRQQRDLVWTFAMGWREALAAAGCIDSCILWDEEFAPLANENWWPDESWRWW